MFRFLSSRPGLDSEITPSTVRLAAVSGRGANTAVLSVAGAELPSGVVTGGYASPNIQDPEQLDRVLRGCLGSGAFGRARRAALSLPDGVFRVQTIEFDELPAKVADRERLIRWRLEKAAAFDVADTQLRYQVLRRRDTGYTVLACVAKQAVLAQYEAVLTGLGLEPWSVGLSSFHTLNFYSSYLVKKSTASVLTHVTEDTFTTIVTESGGVRFYRFKEMKRAAAGELRSRLVREIEDSLHFYTHMDRSQQAEVGHLYLTGQPSVRDSLADELKTAMSLDVEALHPSSVMSSVGEAGADMAAALGAGSSL